MACGNDQRSSQSGSFDTYCESSIDQEVRKAVGGASITWFLMNCHLIFDIKCVLLVGKRGWFQLDL